MSKTQAASFGPETWVKGTRGLLGPHATDRPQIRDARFYRDGSVGPRPRWELAGTIDTSGLETTDATDVRWGPVGGNIMAIGDTYAEVWTTAGVRVLRGNIPPLTGVSRTGPWNRLDLTNYLVGSLQIDTATSGSSFLWGDGFSGVPMSIIDVEDTITPQFLTSGVYATAGSMVHQGRAYFWGNVTGYTGPSGFGDDFSNRIFYSDPYDYDAFTSATQFFDVDGSVAGCISLGSNLFIWTYEAEWFVLQGRGDPADGTLNSLGRGRIPSPTRWPARIDNGAVFLSSDLSAIVSLNASGKLDDLSLAYLGEAEVPNIPFNPAIDPSADSVVNSIVVPHTNDEVRVNHNNVWTEETSPFDMDGDVWLFTLEASATEVAVVYDSGDSWNIYTRGSMLAAPQENAAFETVVSRVTLPRIVQPGVQVRVNRVLVDARTFDDNNPTPFLEATITDGENQSHVGVTGPDVPPFNRAGNATEEFHQLDITFDPPQFTHLSDIELRFQGLVIERVYVEYETNGEPVL